MALNFNMMGLGFHFFVQDEATLGLRRIDQAFKNVSASAEEMYYKTKASLDQMEAKFGALGDARVQAALQRTGMVMAGMGAAGLVGTGAAVKSFGNFQQQMLNAQSVAQWTQEEFQELSKFAIQVGADTKFSGSQAAEAIYEISSAGVTAVKDIKQLTLGVADFAAAGNIQMPEAARAIVAAVQGFKRPMSDAPRIADIFTAAIQNSMLKANEFEVAMGSMAGVAGQVGQSVEAATAGLMAARNVIGSAQDAATSLRSAMMHLIAPTGEANNIMRLLDVSLRDAQGNMKPWPQIIREFQDSFAGAGALVGQFGKFAEATDEELKALAQTYGLTAEQARGLAGAAAQGQRAFEDYVLATIFGKDGIRAVTAGLNAQAEAMIDGREVTFTGADALEYWQIKLENSAGAAKKAADIQMSGLNGAFEELSGSIESAGFVIGSRFEPAVRGLAGFLDRVVDIFNKMPAPMQTVLSYSLLLGSVGLLGAGFGLIFLAQLPGAIQGLTILKSTLLWTKMEAVGARIAALALQGAMLVVRGATLAWTGAQWLLNAALTAAQWTARTAGLLVYRGAMLLAQGATMAWTGVQWALNMALSGLQLAGRIVALGIYHGAILLVRGATMAWAGVQWVLNAALMANPIGLVIGAVVGLVAAFIWVATHAEKVKAALTGVWNWIANVFNLSDQARQWGLNLITGFVEGIENAYEKLKQGLTNAAGWIKKFLGFGSPTELGPGKYADKWAPNMVEMFAGGLRAGLPEVTAAAAGIAKAASQAMIIRPPSLEANLMGHETVPVFSAQPGTAASIVGTGAASTVPGERPVPVSIPQAVPASPPPPAPAPRQQPAAVTGTLSKVAETIRQPIQLVLDGRVVAEIIANIQAENEARAGAY